MLQRYPAPLSVTASAYFFGALLMLLCAVLFVEDTAAWVLTTSQTVAVLYAVRALIPVLRTDCTCQIQVADFTGGCN